MDLLERIKNSPALSEATREAVLIAAQNWDEAQKQKFVTLLDEAELKVQEAKTHFDERKSEINTDYLNAVQHYLSSDVPAAIRNLEETDRKSEDPEAVLNELQQ